MLSEWKKPGMFFELFNDSLVVLIGELVFGLNIAPSHLELTAYKLKLNLVYSIVCNCSPKIPCSSLCSAVCHGYTNAKKWGQIVLNHSQVSDRHKFYISCVCVHVTCSFGLNQV